MEQGPEIVGPKDGRRIPLDRAVRVNLELQCPGKEDKMRASDLDTNVRAATRLHLFCSGFYNGSRKELEDDIARLELLISIGNELISRRFAENDEK